MNRPANSEERSSGRADRGDTRERSGGRALSPGDNRGADRGAGGRSEGGRDRSSGPSRVADVMAVADKATADPTNADAEGFARGEALSFPSKVLFACAPTATGAALLATSL